MEGSNTVREFPAAGAGHLDQRLVTKEDLLAKRLIERQRRLMAPPAAKDRRDAQR